jgi:ADP-ribose pyrophosphatase
MAREIVHRGRKIQVALETTVLDDGHTITRDIIYHPGAVAILPIVDRHHVCLLRNHRPVVGSTLWEIPAGTLEPREPPDQAAIRELAEETGYTAREWRKLGEFLPSPGVMDEVTHLYVADGLSEGPMSLERDEDIKPQIVSWIEAVAWTMDGTIRDGKTLVAILLWDKLRS